MNAIDAAGRAYSAAADEGSVPTLLWSSYLLGACYSNFNDMSFMLKYYKRALELSRGYDATISSLIQYNIGSAYLEHKNFQDAVPYLLTSMQPTDLGLDSTQRFPSYTMKSVPVEYASSVAQSIATIFA